MQAVIILISSYLKLHNLSSTDTEFDLSVLLEERKVEKAVKHSPLWLLIKPLPVVLITVNDVWDQEIFFIMCCHQD